MPREVIQYSCTTTLLQCGINQPYVLAIHLADDGDVLDLLSTEHVCMYMHVILCINAAYACRKKGTRKVLIVI